jgi:hypothetical protein
MGERDWVLIFMVVVSWIAVGLIVLGVMKLVEMVR